MDNMNRILKITLGCLLFGLVILFFTLFFVSEDSANIASTVLLFIPSRVAFGSLALLLIFGAFALIANVFKKNEPPAIINAVFSDASSSKIALCAKPLFLLSQICFCLWSYYFLANLFVAT